MKKYQICAAFVAFFLFFSVTACSQPAPTPRPTSPPPTAVSEADDEATATIAPAATEPEAPTATGTSEPTAVPTTIPTTAPTATQAVSYTISVTSPQPNQAITVGRDFSFSGTVNPIPSQPLELQLTANGSTSNGDSLLVFAEVDPASGSWQLTETIHPRRTGPATLHVRAAGVHLTVSVLLQLAEDETSTIVTVNQPLQGDIVVAGQMLLISGESRNLIDNKIQVGLFGCLVDSDENLLAQIEFEAGNGPWRAQIIPPLTAAGDCDTARLRVTTGGLEANHPDVAWSNEQILTLVGMAEDQANLFTIWTPTQLQFFPGRATTISGTAVNPVNGLVQVELVQNEVVLAAAAAAPDPFGYWETSLVPSADAEPGEAVLRISTGADDAYREAQFETAVGP